MNNERQRAIERFVKMNSSKLQFGESVINGIIKNPELIRESEYRDYAFQAALLKHKIILLRSGLLPLEVYNQSQNIQQSITERNGKSKFMETVSKVWTSTFGSQQGIPTEIGAFKDQITMEEGSETTLS